MDQNTESIVSKIFILIIIGLLKGQIIDPETGKTAELQYNPKTGEYYLFGLDKLKLVDGKLYTGKFIRRTNNLVYFKIVENGGSILEIEIQKISRIISENGKAIIDDLIIEKANIINHQNYLEETAIANGKNENLLIYSCAGALGSMLFGGAASLGITDPQSIDAVPLALISPFITGYMLNKIKGVKYPESIQSNSDKRKYKKLYLKNKNKRVYKYIIPGYLISYLVGGLFYMYVVSS